MSKHKIVVYVPGTHADVVRDAMGKAGAGTIGNYSNASFSSPGTGRFKPEEGAHPTIGEVGKTEEVEEVKIETLCDSELLPAVIEAIKRTHPYEEPAIDAWPLTYPQ